jgi:uncharacterized membrane protein (UPF0182 family)
MEPTLDQAIARIFGTTPTDRRTPAPAATPTTTAAPPPAPSGPAPAGFDAVTWQRMATEARDTYQRALEAQRAGDWAKYGEEIRRLGELLEKMRAPR